MFEYLKQLTKLQIFSLADVKNIIEGSSVQAADMLKSYIEKGLIFKVRRNLYVVADLASGVPALNRYQIAGRISSDSYLCYHSALEFHGVANQPFYYTYFGSRQQIRDFSFDGIDFKKMASPFEDGIITPHYDSFIRVTDMERTVIDCIDKIDRAGGLEELVKSISAIRMLNEDKLTAYIKIYDKPILYKKCGFLLGYFAEKFALSSDFFALCHDRAMNGICYLTGKGESDTYHGDWEIYAPADILEYLS